MSFWTFGNKIQLLEGGEDYFPSLLKSIRSAEKEILFEVFIFREDKIGREVADELKKAAQRGVEVKLLLDGFGCFELSSAFVSKLVKAGIRVHFFRPLLRLTLRNRVFRRLHRKTVCIDRKQAFVGGINITDDQLKSFSVTRSRWDFAVKIEGPLVEKIARIFIPFFARLTRDWRTYFEFRANRLLREKPQISTSKKAIKAAYIIRDNIRYRNQIERYYLAAMRRASKEIIIANAYFFPSYRFLRRLRKAAERGIRVVIVCQGQIEYLLMKWATEALYKRLLKSGVEIYEYRQRLLHSKVAVIDEVWSTVGSCNLDPLSLLLNLEGNLVAENKELAGQLKNKIEKGIKEGGVRIDPKVFDRQSIFKRTLNTLSYFALRWLPTLVGVERFRRRVRSKTRARTYLKDKD